MRLGFLIDNRKCIGCHACTVACKSEHDVPIGVNRTWVKQVETGAFPDVRRSFHVMRCNHCADAPCTEICPVTALYTRPDGIVDFDNDRCIGCKACMQACPYDALYIDPKTHTAAKCNYCSHRVDRGLLPACVVACPEQAIVAGDASASTGLLSHLLATEPVSVRRPEKGTHPSLWYIDGDAAALDPLVTGDQRRLPATDTPCTGGHGADARDVRPLAGLGVVNFLGGATGVEARRVLDKPATGIPWGWQVSAYLATKAAAAGVLFVPLLATLLLGRSVDRGLLVAAGSLSLLMQLLTGVLLVADLERPDRFLNVLFRGNPRSWLVRGAWILTAFGVLSTLWLAALLWSIAAGAPMPGLLHWLGWATLLLTVPTAVYTAFLFAQARGRDLWQSGLQPLHMAVHMIVVGAALLLLVEAALGRAPGVADLARPLMIGGLLLDLLLVWAEIALPHATEAAAVAAHRLHTGRFGLRFWLGVVAASLAACALAWGEVWPAAGAPLALLAIVVRNDLWVRVPQTVALS